MDTDFWEQKWNRNEIGFHKSEANPLLVKYFDSLSLKKDERIFIPLCGKTLDIFWLIKNGFKVVGVELVEIAIEQLFQENNIDFKVLQENNFKHYYAKNLDIYVGNFFDLSKDILGKVDAIYDRAAIVALPEDMRNGYSLHLKEVTNNAPQLVITFDYNQSERQGPPFSVSEDEINKHYKSFYNISILESSDISESMKSKTVIKENVWLLSKK